MNGFIGIITLASVVLHGFSFTPYKNSWDLTITQGTRTVHVGIWTDELRRAGTKKHPLFTRVQVMKIRKTGGAQTWVNTFDPRTLAPVGSALFDTRGNVTLRSFNGKVVRVIDATGANVGNPDATETPQHPAYDFNGGMYGLLFLGLPLRTGLSGVIATYGTADASVEHITFTVRGTTPMTVHGKKITAWVVDCHYLDAHRPEGDAQMRFWLSTRAPYIINLNYDVPSTKTYWRYSIR
jgi:hypothetical protein